MNTRNTGIGGHHKAYRGDSDVWLTPPEIIKALGDFDLDPCAAPDPRPWDTAREHWNRGGLDRKWHGRCFVNPPYGPEVGKWLSKLADHGDGIALIFARTETRAFAEHVWPKAMALLFVEGRLSFYKPDGTMSKTNSGGPSVLIAYGASNVEPLARSGIRGHLVLRTGIVSVGYVSTKSGLFNGEA